MAEANASVCVSVGVFVDGALVLLAGEPVACCPSANCSPLVLVLSSPKKEAVQSSQSVGGGLADETLRFWFSAPHRGKASCG